MTQSRAGAVQKLYTEKLSTYRTFISFFRSRDAIRALLDNSKLLRPKLRILDAGVGFGTVTFALLDALRSQSIEPQTIDAFDLTSAMLGRFQEELDSLGITLVRHKQADVLNLDEQLPSTWSDYDLIVVTSMLEYVPKPSLSNALSALNARLAPDGTLFVVITRRNWITRILSGGRRQGTRARTFDELSQLRAFVILHLSDFLFAISGRTYRTMWCWPNGVERRQKIN